MLVTVDLRGHVVVEQLVEAVTVTFRVLTVGHDDVEQVVEAETVTLWVVTDGQVVGMTAEGSAYNQRRYQIAPINDAII